MLLFSYTFHQALQQLCNICETFFFGFFSILLFFNLNASCESDQFPPKGQLFLFCITQNPSRVA